MPKGSGEAKAKGEVEAGAVCLKQGRWYLLFKLDFYK